MRHSKKAEVMNAVEKLVNEFVDKLKEHNVAAMIIVAHRDETGLAYFTALLADDNKTVPTWMHDLSNTLEALDQSYWLN